MKDHPSTRAEGTTSTRMFYAKSQTTTTKECNLSDAKENTI